MIEKILYDHLSAALATPVYSQGPHPKPAECVIFEKTGGGRKGLLRTATVAVQSCAPSLYEAAALNDDVIGAMDGFAALPEISACRLNADYPFPDTEQKEYRYQAVFDIVYY